MNGAPEWIPSTRLRAYWTTFSPWRTASSPTLSPHRALSRESDPPVESKRRGLQEEKPQLVSRP